MATLLDSWLIHEFTYKEYLGRKEAGGVNLAPEVTVTNCRINIAPSFERNSTETVKVGDATIYCYGEYTEGVKLEDLKERSEVTIFGKNYTVKKVALRFDIDEPGVLFAVEMTVL